MNRILKARIKYDGTENFGMMIEVLLGVKIHLMVPGDFA